MAYEAIFKRKEMKYILNEAQFAAMLAVMKKMMVPDEFAVGHILSLYYDTADHRLIRRSLAKPKYKEKLRLRCYEVPTDATETFLEIKKKCAGVVYKRRTALPYANAVSFLNEGAGDGDTQILKEIGWMLQSYAPLIPAMVLAYDRLCWKGREGMPVRVTFDSDIRYRTDDLDLRHGNGGKLLLPSEHHLMEIKVNDAMPLQLAKSLSELHIYPTSFSKYGRAYTATGGGENEGKELRQYA